MYPCASFQTYLHPFNLPLLPSASLAELYSRPALRKSHLISNPGCFATNSQLLLAPLLPYLSPVASPTIFAISGYSGAGTTATSEPKVPGESLGGGIRAYSLTDHIHEREAGFHLNSLAKHQGGEEFKVNFIPSVAPWFQGIISTLSAPLKDEMRASEVREIFEQFYEGEKLVKVVKEVPEIRDISTKHGVRLGGFQVHSSGKRVVAVVSFSLPSRSG